MRILQVANGYPPVDLGGVENLTRWLVRELAQKNTVAVFCREPDPTRPDGAERDDELDGIAVHRVVNNFNQVAGLADYYLSETIERKFADYVRAWQPDIVHFQHAAGLSATLIEWALRNNIPYIVSIHDYWYICPTVNLLRPDGSLCQGPRYSNCLECVFGIPFAPPRVVQEAARRVVPRRTRLKTLSLMSRAATVTPSNWRLYPVLRRMLPTPIRNLALLGLDVASGRRGLATRPNMAQPKSAPVVRADFMLHLLRSSPYLIVPSQFVKNLYVQHGVPAEQVRVIAHGLELSRWTHFSRLRRPANAPVRFGYIGSLMRHKGVDVAVRAFRQVPNDAISLRIHGFTVSDDPYGKQLLESAAGDTRIQFMGAYKNEELPAIMNDIDVLLIPAIWHETFSIVTHEAMLGQVAVLASKMGAITDAVDDGITGYLLPRSDVSAWSMRIRQLADDPARVAAMQNAQATKRNKSIEAFGDELTCMYEAAVRSHTFKRSTV